MAARRKDVKKASYYVWFLGAKECEGLRGEEYVIPVLRYLLNRENLAEPSKVTLQVSNKGIKIIQNVPRKGCKLAASLTGKTEQIKHLIPHTSITCVVQEEDIVCCILLIYNPITKCPVHVHAYRCDSIETATSLRVQLQVLIDRPENQRKFREIEAKLAAKGLCVSGHAISKPITTSSSIISSSSASKHPHPSSTRLQAPIYGEKYNMNLAAKRLSSDRRSIRTNSSDQTEESYVFSNSSGKEIEGRGGSGSKSPPIDLADTKVAILYESLAAELKAKLGNPKSGPILLPPRDYDTISRKQGKLTGIEARKSTNSQIVGPIVEMNTLLSAESGGSNGSSSGVRCVSKLSSSSDPKLQKKSYSSPSALLSPSSSASSSCKPSRPQSSCKSSSGIGSDEAIPPSPELNHHKFSNGNIANSKSKQIQRVHPHPHPLHHQHLLSRRLLASSCSPLNSSDDSDEQNWSPVDIEDHEWSSSSDSGTNRCHVPPPVIPKMKTSRSTGKLSSSNASSSFPVAYQPKIKAFKNEQTLLVTNLKSKSVLEPPKYYFPSPKDGDFCTSNASRTTKSSPPLSIPVTTSISPAKRVVHPSPPPLSHVTSAMISDANRHLKRVPNLLKTGPSFASSIHHHQYLNNSHHPSPISY